MRDEHLAEIGKDWLRVVELVRRDGIAEEHDHVRFRDQDLSVKTAAVLGFAGLMVAADLVFLSAGEGSIIRPDRSCGLAGFAALYVMLAGALCAVASIMISRRGRYETGWASFGLMKLYHDRRQRWLSAASILTFLGTALYLVAMTVLVAIGRCW